jgi:hypothetical protein
VIAIFIGLPFASSPTEHVIENGKVYWASVDYDGGPELTVMEVEEFITKHDWALGEADKDRRFEKQQKWREHRQRQRQLKRAR